ncbi:MAG: GNAT family N-acetyltransferase [Candidatus Micrarchaeota archaeon]
MTYFIKKAGSTDWKAIFDILSTCTDWLAEQAMNHWKGGHTKEKVIKRIEEKEVYIAYYEHLAVGTITLSLFAPFYYNENDKKFWNDEIASAIYVSALAVLPKYQDKGVATELLKFAEQKAREMGIYYIRFDAVSYYVKLNEFYLKNGYEIVGKRITGNLESNFFEKKIILVK